MVQHGCGMMLGHLWNVIFVMATDRQDMWTLEDSSRIEDGWGFRCVLDSLRPIGHGCAMAQ